MSTCIIFFSSIFSSTISLVPTFFCTMLWYQISRRIVTSSFCYSLYSSFSHAVSCIIHFTFLKISSFLSLIISLTVLYSSFTFYIIDFAYVFHCVLHIILSILLFLICCFCSTSLGCGFWMISWWRIRDDSVRIDSASTWAIHSLYREKYINQRGEVILVQDKLQTL